MSSKTCYNTTHFSGKLNHTKLIISGWAIPVQEIITDSGRSTVIGIDFYNPNILNLNDVIMSIKGSYDVIGFSMGATWLSHNLQYFSEAKSITFISSRFQYNPKVVTAMIKQLQDDPSLCLTSFYKMCFGKHYNEDIHQQLVNLVKNSAYLEEGLHFLKDTPFAYPNHFTCPIYFIHGTGDRVSPLTELKKHLPETTNLHIEKRQGHMIKIES